jgi:hypothetical protein
MTRLVFMLRRYRLVTVVAAVAIAAIGARVSPIHHGMSPLGFWDGPL